MNKILVKDTISILIVNYNGKNQLEDILKSIAKINYKKSKIEVIVTDNNSKDGSIELIAEKYKKVKLIALEKNIGYGPALNIAIAEAKGQYLMVSNNDLTFSKNCLTNLLEYVKKHTDVAIVGGKIISKTNNKKVTSSYQTFNYFTGQIKMDQKAIIKPTEVQWVQGCAMFIPKSKLIKIGSFDPGFEKIYFEDLDLCIRAQHKGFKTVIIPRAVFYHFQSYTIDHVIPKSTKWYNWHKNKIRFAIKHANIFQIATIILVEIITSPYWTIVKGEPNFSNLAKALIWNLRNLESTLQARKAIR